MRRKIVAGIGMLLLAGGLSALYTEPVSADCKNSVYDWWDEKSYCIDYSPCTCGGDPV